MSLTLRIDSLAYGGSAVGRHEGKAVFVPLAAPGDTVRCRPVREKKNYVEAQLEELIEPSALRRAAPCPVFGECGGCQWQHLGYADQVSWKSRIFRDFLERRCAVSNDCFLPEVAAPDEWHYRSRVQFKCRQAPQGFVMGFYRRGSHFIVDIEHCPITAEPINLLLRQFRGWLAHAPCRRQIPQVDMGLDDEGRIRVVVHFIGGDAEPLARYLRPLAARHEFSLFLQCGRKKTLQKIAGEEDLYIRPAAGLRLAYGPGGFAQVNLMQNRTLVGAVCAAARLGGDERVLDLYCGMGNFSLPLARTAGQVVGIEDYAPAISKARENAARNRMNTLTFFAAPAAMGFATEAGRDFDVVILDPPRTGARDLTRELLAAGPQRILYVSCDPSTLARDLLVLLKSGYRVTQAQLFDLFPQTFHIESLTVLERNS